MTGVVWSVVLLVRSVLLVPLLLLIIINQVILIVTATAIVLITVTAIVVGKNHIDSKKSYWGIALGII